MELIKETHVFTFNHLKKETMSFTSNSMRAWFMHTSILRYHPFHLANLKTKACNLLIFHHLAEALEFFLF